VPVREAAARFPLGHPAVAAVLIGLRDAAQVLDAVHRFNAPIPGELWDDLRAGGLLGAQVPVPAGE
jgi:D-threo-aldose 1-dehydrogenase